MAPSPAKDISGVDSPHMSSSSMPGESKDTNPFWTRRRSDISCLPDDIVSTVLLKKATESRSMVFPDPFSPYTTAWFNAFPPDPVRSRTALWKGP